jgi:hypothetical protein
MDIVSRGFVGRRSPENTKLPPGQYLTKDFPVLSAGPTPHVPLGRWEFTIDDGYTSLAALGLEVVPRFAQRDHFG